MGLTSLSYLNKVQHTNYWSNIWNSNKLYKKFLFLNLFLNKYFNIIFSDLTINILIKHLVAINFKKGYLLNTLINNNFFKHILLGKILILKYQKWYIIFINITNLNSKSVQVFKRKKIKKWKSLNINILNYKKQF